MATKLEAFFSRGKTDFLFSRDFEDLVYLFENAEGVEDALANCTGDLKNYLVSRPPKFHYHQEFNNGRGPPKRGQVGQQSSWISN